MNNNKNIFKNILNLIIFFSINLFFISFISIAMRSNINQASVYTGIIKSETTCDRVYAIEMEKALNSVRSLLTTEEQLNMARDYMVLVKQREDINLKIEQIEKRVFTTPIIIKLRGPLDHFGKCRLNINTGINIPLK